MLLAELTAGGPMSLASDFVHGHLLTDEEERTEATIDALLRVRTSATRLRVGPNISAVQRP